jgi:HSP20 family protein
MSNQETLVVHDPFALLRTLTAELDSAFDRLFGAVRGAALSGLEPSGPTWNPEIDVFERDQRLVTKLNLPGVKTYNVKVDITDDHLAIWGERRSETEAGKDIVHRTERSFSSFYRVTPLPPDMKAEDVEVSFDNGVLEVSVPCPTVVC